MIGEFAPAIGSSEQEFLKGEIHVAQELLWEGSS